MSATQRLKTGRSSQFVDGGSGGGGGGGNVVDAAGATVDAFVQVLLNTAPAGLLGIGSILNTAAKSMDVKETGVDKFGNTVSVTTTVPAGDEYLLDLQTNLDTGGGPAMPPFTSYQVEVASTVAGNPTNYELHLIDMIPGSGSGGSSSGLQNSIISAAKTGKNIDFLSVGAGLSVDLLATATPFVCDVGGTHVIVAADTPITITDDENNFIWIDDTGAVGVSPLPCIYAYDEPAGATDQHWFDLGDNQMKVWGGAAFVATSRIFIGYVRADSGTANARYACEPNLMTPSDRFNRLGDGSLGFLEVSAGTTTLPVGLRNYSAIVVRGTGTVTYPDDTGDAQLELRAQGIFVILDTASVTASGLGLPGGVGGTGLSGGLAAAGGGLGGAGGGGGSNGAGTNSGGDGGGHASGQRFPADIGGSGFPTVSLVVYFGMGLGGTSAANGTAGTGNGIRTGYSIPVLFAVGNGGGGGGQGSGSPGAAGGRGGGAIMISAASIAIGSGASLVANGTNGANGSAGTAAGGGGGGGGSIMTFSRVFQQSGTFTATHGSGGAGNGTGKSGGNGADGVALHIYN